MTYIVQAGEYSGPGATKPKVMLSQSFRHLSYAKDFFYDVKHSSSFDFGFLQETEGEVLLYFRSEDND